MAANAPQGRFSEPVKFLPVAFVCLNIVSIYLVYTLLHLIPNLNDSSTRSSAIVELVIFNSATFMLLICYVRAIIVHPGTIPDKAEDPTWEYVAQSGTAPPRQDVAPNLRESKHSTGERRHCKWCAKYKPDRTHHCRVCRTCILKMDHHCPWIYNCVGFANHKFFFLLLFYCVIVTHMVAWTMLGTVEKAVDSDTPFAKMFLLLFGETLAAFLALLLTTFFCFHIYLMMKAMTTIEFCEKQLKRSEGSSSPYDRGCFGNMKAVLGDNVLSWPFPVLPPSGNGLNFNNEQQRLAYDLEPSRGVRRSVGSPEDTQKEIPLRTDRRRKRRGVAGTGETGAYSVPDSGASEASFDADEEDSLCGDPHRGDRAMKEFTPHAPMIGP